MEKKSEEDRWEKWYYGSVAVVMEIKLGRGEFGRWTLKTAAAATGLRLWEWRYKWITGRMSRTSPAEFSNGRMKLMLDYPA